MCEDIFMACAWRNSITLLGRSYGGAVVVYVMK